MYVRMHVMRNNFKRIFLLCQNVLISRPHTPTTHWPVYRLSDGGAQRKREEERGEERVRERERGGETL